MGGIDVVTYKRDKIYNLIIGLVLSLIGIVCLFPMLYVVVVSLTPYEEYLRQGGIVLIPRQLTFEAYGQFWQEPHVMSCFMNTVLISTVGTALNLLVTVLMAYALAKKDLLFGRFFTFFCLVPLLIGGGMIPTYLVVKNTGLTNSVWSLMIPQLVSPYTLLITRTFFAGVDQSLHESARIDGAKEFSILFRIILPVSAPILATIGLMYGVAHWNEYFGGLLYISDASKRTLQVVLREMLKRADSLDVDAAVPTRTLQMAGVVITAIPVIVVYPFLQKYFTQGIMLGAIKG